MLTLLNDPAGITGRRRIPWGPGTVLEQVMRAMPEGGGGCTVRFNGVEIDPVADPRMAAAPAPSDEVVIVHRPEGVELWVLAVSVLLAAYSYSLIPKPTDQPTLSDSPNNRLTGQTNIARAYQAIPDVYGRRRVWPDLIQQSAVHYDADGRKLVTELLCISRGKGTAEDLAYADTLLQDIPGASSLVFEPSASPNTYPEDNLTTVTDLLEVTKSPEVNGQELSSEAFPSGITRTSVVTFSSPTAFTVECDDGSDLGTLKSLSPTGSARVDVGPVQVSIDPPQWEYFSDECTVLGYSVAGSRVTFSFQALNYAFYAFSNATTTVTMYAGVAAATVGPFTLPKAGNRIRANIAFLRGLKGTVNVDAEFWQIDGAGAEIAGTRQTVSSANTVLASGPLFTADTYDQRFFTWDITPSAGTGLYKVQFTRTTADLGNGADVAKLDELYAMTYSATRTYPGVTLVRLVTVATPQATGIRERRFNLWWTRKVRTLSSTTLSTSRNFARALVHLWATSGNDVAEIDTTTLQAINAEFGEDSPLLRFDWSFDDANLSIGERLQAIANAARCVLWRDGGLWTVTRDQLRTTPQMQFDYRNLAASGESQITDRQRLPASEDGIELEFIEEDDQAAKDYVRLDISSGAVVVGASANPKKVKLIGCATRDQALNRAHLDARKLLYQRVSVSDTALADAAELGPGALVRWIDPCDFYADDGLQGGEVLDIDGTTIETSEPLQWGGEVTGRMLLTGTDGQYLGAPVVVTPSPLGSKWAVLATVPGGLYVRDETRQLGSRYAFGAGLTASEIAAAGLYTLTDIKPASDRTVGVSLVNYDERLYAMDNQRPVGIAMETDTAFALMSNVAAVGRATEINTAMALAGVQKRAVGMASETDTALAL